MGERWCVNLIWWFVTCTEVHPPVDRVQWFRAQAHRDRWQEEVELLEEEFHCTFRSFTCMLWSLEGACSWVWSFPCRCGLLCICSPTGWHVSRYGHQMSATIWESQRCCPLQQQAILTCWRFGLNKRFAQLDCMCSTNKAEIMSKGLLINCFSTGFFFSIWFHSCTTDNYAREIINYV